MSKPPTIFERPPGRTFREGKYILGGVLAILVLLWLAGSASAQSEIEFKVKAAFLFNFAKFTEWPPGRLTSTEPLVIGCFSGPDFIEALEATVAGRTVGSRRILVKRVGGADDLRGCHILFVARAQDDSATALLARGKQMHILTVGESAGFTARGGMIGFVLADGGVKFAINQQQTDLAGLKISSKLLGLAVTERQGGG